MLVSAIAHRAWVAVLQVGQIALQTGERVYGAPFGPSSCELIQAVAWKVDQDAPAFGILGSEPTDFG